METMINIKGGFWLAPTTAAHSLSLAVRPHQPQTPVVCTGAPQATMLPQGAFAGSNCGRGDTYAVKTSVVSLGGSHLGTTKIADQADHRGMAVTDKFSTRLGLSSGSPPV
ncbi:MAG: hypothetical protein AVDCRST_MAG75-1415 [uncultured Propionibacteriaceae bacterium]|uniref:Uncharacterized protein n=1 Tax=uncultured Propionibacteriaceae bacterium TaxID=257457 RepID=A0A6J4NPL6_9ACTN|nr:MAG: hypothetical protein AVDCRST_MAG75-1415 [uncultured Propionibacteriaceae bacterium]